MKGKPIVVLLILFAFLTCNLVTVTAITGNEFSASFTSIADVSPQGSKKPLAEEVLAEEPLATYYEVKNKYTGKLLRVKDGSTATNADIVQYTDNNWDSQRWEFISVGGGYYKIKNKRSGKLLRPYNAGTGNNVKIVQYPDNNYQSQQWLVTEQADGYYEIKNRYTGKLLRPYNAGTGNNVQIVQYTDYNYGSQRWALNQVGGGQPGAEKIAVFFWASDAGAQWVIDKYINILQGEGYTKFFNFRNSYNVQSDMNSVDAYEGSEDTIFFYVFGHGNNNGQHSYTAFRPSGTYIYSNQFRSMMDNLEAGRKAIFTESCHSGDWADDFRASPYLAMSTSDETHLSYAVGPLPNEGKMSKYFFNAVDAGYNAVDAWYYARQYVQSQYPKIADYSSYVWFN